MAELPNNVKEFATIAALVFAQLYKAFPLPINIDSTAIAVAMGIDKNNWQAHVLPSERTFSVMQGLTIAWLNGQDYIQASGARPAERVVLTAKGLAAMNALPAELGGQTIGTKLIEAAEAKSSSFDYSKIGDFLGGLFGGYTKSMGSG